MIIRPAKDADEVKLAHKQIASKSKHIRDFSNHIFSGETQREKGWIRVAEKEGVLVGFTCVRHKVRTPVTELYFIGVAPGWEGHGIGQALIQDLIDTSPHHAIELNVAKDNHRAISFYRQLGFLIVGEGLKGKAHRMRLTWRAS